jgi:hypothetical protein
MAVAVCLLGVVLAPREISPECEPKTHVVPVKNTAPHRGSGLRV